MPLNQRKKTSIHVAFVMYCFKFKIYFATFCTVNCKIMMMNIKNLMADFSYVFIK